MNMDELLAKIHVATSTELLRRIEEGEATSADLSVARQLLKDNHITAEMGQGTPLDAMAEAVLDLPDFKEEDNVVSMAVNQDGK